MCFLKLYKNTSVKKINIKLFFKNVLYIYVEKKIFILLFENRLYNYVKKIIFYITF